MTPKGMQKDIKHDFQQNALRKENEQITIRVFSPVLCKNSFGSTRQNVTPKEMWKDIKHDLQKKALRKVNEQITMRVFSQVS